MFFSISGLTRVNAIIISHPKDVTKCATNNSTTITFQVKAIGKNQMYQWQVFDRITRSWNNLANGTVDGTPTISGAGTNTLNLVFGSSSTFLTTSWSGYTVRCIASGEISNVATLDVIINPTKHDIQCWCIRNIIKLPMAEE